MKVLVTGSCGLIGSEAVEFYHQRAEQVVGIDNNSRALFFGPDGDTSWMRDKLVAQLPNYRHCSIDIVDRDKVAALVEEFKPDLVIHAAAQPSHDLAARIPYTDFEVNAVGTLNLLESVRQHAPQAVFIFLSTNKVYGDSPNRLELREGEKRWDFADGAYSQGIDESLSIDQSKHSLFGASKLAADVMVQEYGRYFGLKTGVFRGGCLTGSSHSGAELHGFLSYFFKVAYEGRQYTIFGYQGKQVRDQIHSRDVLAAFDLFYRDPRPGAVYNIGGGKANSVSILQCIDRVETMIGDKIDTTYSDEARIGDHICYYSDMSRFKGDYPSWEIEYDLDAIFEGFAQSFMQLQAKQIV